MIDLAAGGIFAAILGDDPPEIRDTINRFPGPYCSYAPHRQNYWRDRYIDMLKEFTGYESVALFSTGAEATEAFWRACRCYNGKPGVWGGLIDPDEVGLDHPRCDAMHGMTMGAMLMAGRLTWPLLGIYPELGGEFGGRFGLPADKTCCMIIEPYHAPSAQFHKVDPTINRIKSLQSTFPDIPLCVDEIQGGFGRTGRLWAHEWYQAEDKFLLKPEFVTIGKLCGGGFPLSALLGPKEIMESDSVKEFAHLHSTHSGHPLMCAIGCRVIEEIKRQYLFERSRELGELLHVMLEDLPVRHHSGRGLLAGVEMWNPEEVKQVVSKCLEAGVHVCDTGRKWVKIGPALNIELNDLTAGVKALIKAVGEVVNARPKETEVPSCGDLSEGPEAGSPGLQGAGV